MNPETSPFSPGQPVPIEFFVGRIREIERLRSMVNAGTQGKFRIGFVSGERGIGKSSLASFVRHLSEHESQVAGCHVFLGGVEDLKEMLRRTFDRLLKESMDKPWHEQIKNFFGNHVRKVGLFGVTLELSLKDSDLSTLAHDFVPTVTRLLDSLKGHKSTLFLVLDDINGLAGSEVFANWLKSTVDEVSTSRRKIPLCILVVGLEERRQELVAKQPSLARVFELIDIAPWSDDEAMDFYRKSFDAVGARIAESDMQQLVRLTGGLPVLAHEIGDAVWRTARGPGIESREVREGILTAAEVIGRKLLEPQVFSAIRSERYRSILRKMSDEFRRRFRRSELMERLTGEEKKVMDNFLQRMKRLGALETDPETKGGYQFPNLLHALYFWMESQRISR